MTANVELLAPPVSVPVNRIEAELTAQLHSGRENDEGPVRRARMSNLVIFCNSNDQAEIIEKTIPDIVAEHPARVLLLIEDHGAGPVTASVNVWCQSGGPRQRLCSEQVTLRSGPQYVDHLPYSVRGLLIGDLPTNLWWAAPIPPPQAGPILYDLSEHAQQIIYDSIGWTHPARGVDASSSWLANFEHENKTGSWRVASDLNWRRLKFWRRMLSQALDPGTAPGAMESISEVLVEHGPHAVVQAWELVSWLASRLGWHVLSGRVTPGTELTWRLLAEHGYLFVRIKRLAEGPSEIRKLRIACKVGDKPGALNLVVEERRLSVVPEGMDGGARSVAIKSQPLAELVSRQLSDREHDPVFRESMEVAQIFARSMAG